MAGAIAELESVDDDGTLKAQLIKSISHVQEFTNYNNWGIDSVPKIGSKVYLLPLGSQNNKIGVGVRRPEAQAVSKPGETRLYSDFGSQVYLKDDGTTQLDNDGGAKIILRTNGKVEINGNSKSTVKFEDLKAVYDALVVHIDSHLHPDPVSGFTGVPTVPTPPGASDITPSKNDTVLLNG